MSNTTNLAMSSISSGIPQALLNLSILFLLVGHSFPHFVLDTCLSVSFCFEVPVVTEPLQYPSTVHSDQGLKRPLKF